MKLILKLVIACILCTMLVSGGASAASSTDCLRVELIGDSDIGLCQNLFITGVFITDCYGHHFSSTFNAKRFEDNAVLIDLSGSGLSCDKPFIEVKVHFTLYRGWGFLNVCKRFDKFTLDVIDLVTKPEGKPNTLQLKAYNHYKIGQADAVDIYDSNNNLLKHFGPTHKEGYYGSWDYSLTKCFRVEFGCNFTNSYHYLIVNGVCITDSYGSKFTSKSNNVILNDRNSGGVAEIDLSRSGLKCDKPFKEVKLYLTLRRCWMTYDRFDKFTLDVTDLVTKDKPYTVRLKAYQHYDPQADAVDIYDCNNNLLKHFDATGNDGSHGSWD